MKKIVVLGGGESGVGSAILAKKQGYHVFLSDSSLLKEKYRKELLEYGIAFEEGIHTPELLLDASEIIKSPGIPNTSQIVQQAIAKGIPILSEMEFAKRFTDAKMICITGSNGKTTTTSLVYHILKRAGLNVGLGGNIGQSFARQVALEYFDYYVLELSSFQLENMYEFRADIAILLNITPDHLDRYDYDMSKYVEAKLRIIQNQTENDAFIFWEEDPLISKAISKLTTRVKKYAFAEHKIGNVAAYCKDDIMHVDVANSHFEMDKSLLAIIGIHNLYNSLASGIAAKLLDISDEQLRLALQDFRGVEHRLEFVAKVKGTSYINDSKATNVNSCWYALKSMTTPTILILGGTDKGNDYTEIEQLVKEKCKGLIFLGKDNKKLHDFFATKVSVLGDVDNMQEAVKLAHQHAAEEDTVLLSPCCASFDLFKNYEDRGNQFKLYVRQL